MWDKHTGMFIHQRSPFNAETPRAVLQDFITPVSAFYSRNHGSIPGIDPRSWQLSVAGRVAHPRTFTFEELTCEFDVHAVTATLQCAGNRRAGLSAVRTIPGEDPWGPGATSTAEWRGARLADVLATVGATDDDRLHVAFHAPDVTPMASPPQQYGSSISITKARRSEVLLAWGMNCQPLPRIHGGPVRVIVPGYIGARSVKWLTGITVDDRPSDNDFQASAYRILPPDAAPPGSGIALSSLPLNCEFVSHSDGDRVPDGPLIVSGYALAGDQREIARVDVSLDDGATWSQADLEPAVSRWAWRPWSFALCARAGPLHLAAQAFDDTAATQPETPAALWNPKGYCNNSWARLNLDVS